MAMCQMGQMCQVQQVLGCHRVPIVFKKQMHFIDVLSLEAPGIDQLDVLS